MTRILVTYASKYEATAEIARKIAETIGAGDGLHVTVKPVGAVMDVSTYDAVVLGSAIYAGQWMGEAVDFITAQAEVLARKPTWVFSSGPTGAGDAVELLDGHVYPAMLEATMQRIAPRHVVLFHGSVDPDTINASEKQVLERAGKSTGDFRDWQQITDWAQNIVAALAS